MIASVLVANRGEIAVRIIRTCRRLGIRTIAVFSDADAHALHVAEADTACRIGPPAAAESYLDQAAILEAANRSGARAIHPGYGFLAENADFAQACIDAGFLWVGPTPAAMRLLGDKAAAKVLAARHGVPLLAGEPGAGHTVDVLAEHAQRIGYPLMIKAAAGGGGRGMRVVEEADGFSAALAAARREAQASFGDDRVLLERYVRRARHVEIQILGDQHGHLVHLGERECSVQRRHQKLIEETPSPAVDAGLRSAMTAAALRLAQAAGYTNAGTVEFLLEPDGNFAFLEVNARLQVEHPITEAVTGLDLVEWQLRIADGEALPFTQADVRCDGHAIEARVIAEDALGGFLPSSGTLDRFSCPPGVRVDTWVQTGTVVSPYYDSLLAKVVSYAPTREAAVAGLAAALAEIRIEGVQHNVDLLLAVIQHPSFQQGDLETAFLDTHHIVDSVAEIPAPALAAASALDALRPPDSQNPWRTHAGWRIGRIDQPAAWSRAGRIHRARVTAELNGDGVRVRIGTEGVRVGWLGMTDAGARVSVDGLGMTDTGPWVRPNGLGLTVRALDADRRIVVFEGRAYRLERPRVLEVDDVLGHDSLAEASGRVTAPMPGRVVNVSVSAGQAVNAHQPLLVLEAMKMEHVLEAPRAGTVAEVLVRVGDQVTSGADLLRFSPRDVEDAEEG